MLRFSSLPVSVLHVERSVVILGGGFGGLAAAKVLRREVMRVTLLDRQNQVIGHLGDNGPESWKTLRTGPRENFPAGRFVCPHSATFDRHGNIFVVEWVEVGRVTKLRKV